METDYETIRISSMEDQMAAEVFGCARNYGFDGLFEALANLAAWPQKVVCLLFLSFFLSFSFSFLRFFFLSFIIPNTYACRLELDTCVVM